MNNKQNEVIDAACRYVRALYAHDETDPREFSLAERLNAEARRRKAQADLVIAVDLLEGNE